MELFAEAHQAKASRRTHVNYELQITNCKHFQVFTLQFISKINFIQNKISQPRFTYLLFVIIICILIAFCLTLHPISRHIESKTTVN